MAQGGFEELEVWRKAKEVAVEVYNLTKKFPKEDAYTLTSQIRRSSLSISSNIAEGTTYSSKKQFVHFIQIAHGSCAELRTQLIIANEVGNIDDATYLKLKEKLLEIGRMLKGLERSQATTL